MITKEQITRENFEALCQEVAVLREEPGKSKEALEGLRLLREFAIVNEMRDKVVQTLLEEALVWQHEYMDKKNQEDLAKMESLVQAASSFVAKNNLVAWESRVSRFSGRVEDYKKNYAKALEYYQIALDKVLADPKYTENPALGYEYAGFMVIDKIRLGEVDLGIVEAKKLYEDYMLTEEGAALRKNDYATWAIWRSGLLINLSKVLIDLGVSDKYRGDILVWLELAEQNLRAPEGVTLWTDFGFRKKEIAEIREMLG